MFKLGKIVALFSLLFVSSAYAQQATDYSLSLPGWTSGGNTGATQGATYNGDGIGVSTVTGSQTINCCGPNTWVMSPYTGSTMVGLQPGSFTATYSNMTNALGLSSASASALSAEIAAQNPSGGGSITNGAWISKDFTFGAPTTFSMYWVYTSTDYVPFNDGSITTLVNTSDASVLGKINGKSAQYILLGATNPGTGNYSTDSYGSTGWQQVNYQILTNGTYKLGFAAFNQGDTALSPILFVNDGLGTVTKNGQIFGAVAPNDPTMPDSSGGGSSGGGSGGGTPPTPTVVSTTPTTPDVTSSTVYGTTTTASLVTLSTTNDGKNFNVNKSSTPVSSTPYTTTTVSTPKVIQTWSDNTTTTITDPSNNPTTTTTNGVDVLVGNSSSENKTASSSALSDAMKYNANFPFMVDPLTVPDGAWGVPSYGSVSTNGKYSIKGASTGYQKTIDNNTVGIALNASSGSSGGYNNSTSDFDSYSGTAYILSKQPGAWIKAAVGTSFNEYKTNTSIPAFNLSNSSKVSQSLFYGDVAVYSPKDFNGVRPFVGVTAVTSSVNNATETGSPHLSTLPSDKNTNKVNPYVGLKYDYNKNVNVVVRATQTQD